MMPLCPKYVNETCKRMLLKIQVNSIINSEDKHKEKITCLKSNFGSTKKTLNSLLPLLYFAF